MGVGGPRHWRWQAAIAGPGIQKASCCASGLQASSCGRRPGCPVIREETALVAAIAVCQHQIVASARLWARRITGPEKGEAFLCGYRSERWSGAGADFPEQPDFVSAGHIRHINRRLCPGSIGQCGRQQLGVWRPGKIGTCTACVGGFNTGSVKQNALVSVHEVDQADSIRLRPGERLAIGRPGEVRLRKLASVAAIDSVVFHQIQHFAAGRIDTHTGEGVACCEGTIAKFRCAARQPAGCEHFFRQQLHRCRSSPLHPAATRAGCAVGSGFRCLSPA